MALPDRQAELVTALAEMYRPGELSVGGPEDHHGPQGSHGVARMASSASRSRHMVTIARRYRVP